MRAKAIAPIRKDSGSRHSPVATRNLPSRRAQLSKKDPRASALWSTTCVSQGKRMSDEQTGSPQGEQAMQSNAVLKEAAAILQGLSNGGSFGTAVNFNEKMAEALYSRGYVQYQQGRYEDAKKTFGYIIFNDPINVRAMRGMASSLQMLGEYQHALTFLVYAAMADDDNADVSLQLVECFLHLGRKSDALALLSDIRAANQNDPQDDYISKKISGLSALLGLDENKSH